MCSSLVLASCRSVEKQEVSDLKVEDVSKKEVEKKPDIKEDVVEEQEEPIEEVEVEEVKEEPVEESKEVKEEEIVGSIDDRNSTIGSIVNSLHSFDQPTLPRYEAIVKQLEKHHVSVDDTVKGPYGLYDVNENTNPSIVVAAISNGVSVAKTDFGYEITVKTRVGSSQFVDSVSYTATAIKSEIRKSNYRESEKDVKYHLNVSEDRQSASLTRVSGQWW